MKNQVIKVLNKKHGEEVIQYWKGLGFDTRSLTGQCTEEDGNYSIYYGIINGDFNNYNLNEVKNANAEIITTNTIQYPKVMEVSNNNGISWCKRVVFMEKNGEFIAWSAAETLEGAEKKTETASWRQAREIEVPVEPQIVELTIQDISDGKGVGVNPELIRIKK